MALSALVLLSEPTKASSRDNSVRQGLPGRRISGGSRSPDAACLLTPDQPVVALMPKSNLGLTLSERPTLWFSLPAISTGRKLEFGLYSPAGELVHKESFNAPEDAGITSLKIPETFAPLTVGEDHRWYLSVVCNPQSRSEDLVVTGWIRRIPADNDFEERIAKAVPYEQISIYQESALWLEALATLVEVRLESPNNTALERLTDEKWVGLLESVDLLRVAMEPLSSQPISP